MSSCSTSVLLQKTIFFNNIEGVLLITVNMFKGSIITGISRLHKERSSSRKLLSSPDFRIRIHVRTRIQVGVWFFSYQTCHFYGKLSFGSIIDWALFFSIIMGWARMYSTESD